MNTTAFNLAIFDCDGVLNNSKPLANKVDVQMLRKYGYQVETEEYQREFSGVATFKRLEGACNSIREYADIKNSFK